MLSRKKEEYRQYYLNIRENFSPEEVKEKSNKICQTLLSLPLWQRANVVMLYVAVRNEVDTVPLIQAALNEAKTVLLPRVENKAEIVPYKIKRFPEDVSPGFAGIPEPIPQKALPWHEKIDLIVVPGVVFDVRGGRIGYGLGYYDRFLKKMDEVIKIGLTFERCLTYALPLEPQDEIVDIVITEEHLFKVEK
jgi:5-formyltetrahydrofolate cyclo-ligase